MPENELPPEVWKMIERKIGEITAKWILEEVLSKPTGAEGVGLGALVLEDPDA